MVKSVYKSELSAGRKVIRPRKRLVYERNFEVWGVTGAGRGDCVWRVLGRNVLG